MPKIVSLVPLSAQDAAAVRCVDPSVELVEAGSMFQGEYAQTWPVATIARYVSGSGQGTRAERDALLDSAEIVISTLR